MKPTKNRILDAAASLLLSRGPAGMSVRAIAAEAGISTIGIYSHFEGKQGVLNALYKDGFERVYEEMNAANMIEDPREALIDGMTRYLDWSLAYEAHYRLIFGETDLGFEPSDEAREAGKKAFDCLADLVAKILPEKASDRTRQIIALRMWAQLHGFVSLRHHAIKDLISIDDWMPIIRAAMEDAIDGVINTEKTWD